MSMRSALLLVGCLVVLAGDARGRTPPERTGPFASQPPSRQPPVPPGAGKPKPGVASPLPPPLPPETKAESQQRRLPIHLEVVPIRGSRSVQLTLSGALPLENCWVSYSAPAPPPSKAKRLRSRTDSKGHVRMTIQIPPSIGSTVRVMASCASQGDELAAVETVRLGK
jgi:hypothetical protein